MPLTNEIEKIVLNFASDSHQNLKKKVIDMQHTFGKVVLKLIAAVTIAVNLFSCKNDSPAADKISLTEVPSPLIVNVDQLRMRDKPGEKGEVIATLQKGTQLADMGEVSNFTQKIILRGIEYDEPWLKVSTTDSIVGWVFAGAITFDMSNPTELARTLMNKRLLSLFGKELTEKIDQYRAQFNLAARSREFADAYRTGEKLRDTLIRVLERKLEISDLEQAPDLFWLKDAMPAFQPQLVAEGTAYHLFHDFKTLHTKANATEGEEDNEFVELCLLLFPEDSIEYFYPAWFIQTWDYGGHSLFGRGVHLQILEEMEEVLEANDLFEAEILKIKAKLIDDITSQDVTYWESAENILKELDAIIAANFSILSESDKIALTTRRKMFEAPEENNIQLDQRTGISDF